MLLGVALPFGFALSGIINIERSPEQKVSRAKALLEKVLKKIEVCLINSILNIYSNINFNLLFIKKLFTKFFTLSNLDGGMKHLQNSYTYH